ncbi:MAG: hypothetical protein JSV04_15260 [Candidatus Heimdallarchaeota archaeon]|nr:MAG: hypothetical protein JSV04_15260 [Candidatus Heimdallarchaeota archaeon]
MSIVNADTERGEHVALDCLQELELGFKPDSGVEAVALIDRIPGKYISDDDWSETRYYHVKHDNDSLSISSEVMESPGELNLGSPSTLRNFVSWAQTEFPAEHYALTYIGHGGAIGGFSFDASHGGDHLTLSEFQNAMDGLFVDVVALDACKMGAVEVAYECRSFTDYIVFSEQYAVTEGFDYESFLQELCDNPFMEPWELGDCIARTSVEFFEWKYDHTRSVINCTALSQFISGFSAFANELISILPTEIQRISDLRFSSYCLDHSYVDIGSFLEVSSYNFTDIQSVSDSAINALNSYQEVVLYNYNDEYSLRATGMVTYFPQDNQSQTNIWDLSSYTNPGSFLDFDELDFLEDCTWIDFIREYMKNAPIIEQKPIQYIDMNVNTSYSVTITPTIENVYYKLEITESGIYQFSLDVESGDLGMYVLDYYGGFDLGTYGYLFSDIQNPEQGVNEKIVHWLDNGFYSIEIGSWTENANGTLTVVRVEPELIELDDMCAGSFPPQRGPTPPIMTIYNYHLATLDVGDYDIMVDISDHALLDIKIWNELREDLIDEFLGIEGEDYYYHLSLDSPKKILIEFGCYEWTGTFKFSITESIAPNVAIKSPIYTTYTTSDVQLNYSISKGNVIIFIDGISNDTTVSSGTVLSDLPNGVHNLTIIATDFMGRVGKSTVIFNVEIPLSSTPESSTQPSSLIIPYTQ